jgi:predicted transcriptional regulator
VPKIIRFTHEEIERVRDILAKAPEKPKVPPPLTVREMVVSIKAEIQDLVKRGYGFGEIAEMIRSGADLEHLGAATLKQYLNRKRTTSKTPKTSSSKSSMESTAHITKVTATSDSSTIPAGGSTHASSVNSPSPNETRSESASKGSQPEKHASTPSPTPRRKVSDVKTKPVPPKDGKRKNLKS